LTHRMTVRTALIRTRTPTDHQGRTLFDVEIPSVQGRPDARALILFARDVATQHVVGFCVAANRATAKLPRTKDPEIYARIWKLRERDGLPWRKIAKEIGIPESALATIRKAAVGDGRAIKEPNGRVRWLPPYE
jgi:hypothetical protein